MGMSIGSCPTCGTLMLVQPGAAPDSSDCPRCQLFLHSQIVTDPAGPIEDKRHPSNIRRVNPPLRPEPTPTCPEHPGEYGTNCPACEQDQRMYREWRKERDVHNSRRNDG